MRRSLYSVGLALILCLVFSQVACAQFSDEPSADNWVYESFKLVYDAGLILGYPDGTVRLTRPALRAEVVEFMARLMTYLEEKCGTKDEHLDAGQVKALIGEALTEQEGCVTEEMLEERVDEIYEAMQDVEESIREDLDALDVRVTTLEETVDELKAKDAVQDAAVAKLQADLSATNQALDEAKAQAKKDAEAAMKEAKKAKSLSIIGIILGILGIFLP